MSKDKLFELWKMIGLRYKSHPWHGIKIGDRAPEALTAFIEVVPTDNVKYEVDKETGYLKVDRPQKFSNIIPALYGFIPQTYCGESVADLCRQKTQRYNITGDKDPLDICILTERHISHGDIMVQAIPIGGFRMIDGGEADDKIIAILKGDEVYNEWNCIRDIPESLVIRLKHYFLTYKEMPGMEKKRCEITHIYDKTEAHDVINRSIFDYKEKFGNIGEKLSSALLEAIEYDDIMKHLSEDR